MSKKLKPYIVRGFNLTKESSGYFDCTGEITKFASFTEIVVNTQADAIVEMLTNSALKTMSTRMMIEKDVTRHLSPDQIDELYVIDVKFLTDANSVSGLRQYRTAVRSTLKTWAEKSRVKGRRGWRASAIKTPTYEYDSSTTSVVIRTQFILSNAITYSNSDSIVNMSHNWTEEVDDLTNLKKGMEKALKGQLVEININHSIHGKHTF